jgi:phosphoribosyl 1,2-cyclic phosphodiesterase
MSLYIASLNSGSNGNCYYVGNEQEAVFIDAGLSCRETERRMGQLGLPMSRVKAIFVSHEHSDHISGLPVLAKKFDLPVYGTINTLRNSRISGTNIAAMAMQPHKAAQIGGLSITAFPKFHDACDPHSFTVSGEAVTVGVFTDLGRPCEQLVSHFKQCHAAFLEANYDDKMLTEGRYPPHLKNRIRGGHGHLSNAQALQLFTTHRPPFMSHLFLSHLSKENNCPKLVQRLFNNEAGDTEIVVASRYKESGVYQIQHKAESVKSLPKRPRNATSYPLQLSLF